jgi:hypothetical protein
METPGRDAIAFGVVLTGVLVAAGKLLLVAIPVLMGWLS